jgi:hypothetical protein
MSNLQIGILEKYYINDHNGKDRIQTWRNKVVDPSIVIFELDNTYISLGELAHSNGLGEKYGDSTEAPKLWQEGRVEELIAHCKQVRTYWILLLTIYTRM